MSGTHKKTDICDLHANINRYGLGAGVYPKASAPQPPLHPFCRCVVVPMIALSPKLKPVERPNAERLLLSSLPPNEARQIAGSREKLARALKGGESLEAIYNEGKDALYKWKTVGDILKPGLQKAPPPVPVKIQHRGKTSSGFKNDVKAVVSSLPTAVATKLQQAGAKVVAGRRVINISPSLKGVQPRGWPAGLTWDNADGFANGLDAVVAEEYRDAITNQYVKTRRASGVLRHEVGHVYDRVLGDMSKNDPAFIAAYQSDLKIVQARPDAPLFSYFTQSGEAGRSETFAELFAELLGGGAGNARVAQAFPATAAILKKVL
jgi:hypothetical protein